MRLLAVRLLRQLPANTVDAVPAATDRSRRVAWAAFVVGLVFAAFPVVKAADGWVPLTNKDYSLWYEYGLVVRDGGPLYTTNQTTVEVRYMYPPTLAVLVFPLLTYLGYAGFVAACGVATAAAWAWCVWLSAKLAGGDRTGVLAAVAALSTVAYVWDMFHLGQVNLILLALVLTGAYLSQLGWLWPAGACVAAAAAIKAFPLTVAVYFIARRQWAAAVSTVVSLAVILVVLPAPFRGFDRNWGELRQWAGMMVGDQSGSTMAARSSIGFGFRNQSLTSVSHRLLRPVDAATRGGVPYSVNVADVSAGTAQNIGMGVGLLLGGVLLLVTRLRFAPTPRAEGLEWAMVLVLCVLVSPLAFTYFFCWLMPAWAAAVAFVRKERATYVRRVAVGGMMVSGLLLASALTEHIDKFTSAIGLTMWGSVGLYLTLAGMRWHVGRVS